MEARRIMTYGVTGSGKTTYARKVAEATGLPIHEMDEICWNPGWTQVDDEEQRRRVAEICAGDAWVIDTAYGKWLDIPMERVQLVLGLDYPRWLSLSRLIRRAVTRAIDKKPVCNGNTESWRQMFSRESIILWHFRSFRRKSQRMNKWAAQEGDPQVVLFRHPREAEAWLTSLRERGAR